MKKITSRKHPIVKELFSLCHSKKARYSAGKAIVLGEKILREIAPHVHIHQILSTQPSDIRADEPLTVPIDLIKKITGLPHPEPILGVVSLPKFCDLKSKTLILGLDGISDPGNMGTLLRSALAFGFEGAMLSPSCVDPFNDKALRAAKGATFLLPMQMAPLPDATQHALIADLEGDAIESVSKDKPLMLVLGNEAHGVSQDLTGTKVHLPMSGKIDSLNVAIAGSILMYKLWEKTTT